MKTFYSKEPSRKDIRTNVALANDAATRRNMKEALKKIKQSSRGIRINIGLFFKKTQDQKQEVLQDLLEKRAATKARLEALKSFHGKLIADREELQAKIRSAKIDLQIGDQRIRETNDKIEEEQKTLEKLDKANTLWKQCFESLPMGVGTLPSLSYEAIRAKTCLETYGDIQEMDAKTTLGMYDVLFAGGLQYHANFPDGMRFHFCHGKGQGVDWHKEQIAAMLLIEKPSNASPLADLLEDYTEQDDEDLTFEETIPGHDSLKRGIEDDDADDANAAPSKRARKDVGAEKVEADKADA